MGDGCWLLREQCLFQSRSELLRNGMVRITVTIARPVEPTRHSWLGTIREHGPHAQYDPQNL